MGANGIYGLSGSGIDIESMVKVGMMSKQNEYDKMAQKYTKNEWMKSAYIELSSSISTFNLTKLSDYKMTASMKAKTAVSSSDAVKATANASADFRTHNVEVTNLVSNAALVGTNKMTRYGIISDATNQSSMKLADVLFRNLIKTQETDNDGNTVTRIRGNIAGVNMTDSSRSDPTDKDHTDAYSFGKKTETATFGNAAWNAGTSRYESGEFYASALTLTDNEGTATQWRYNHSPNSGWERLTGTTTDEETGKTTEIWETDTPDIAAFNLGTLTASNITWTTDSAEWTEESENEFTRPVAALKSSEKAFTFTIGDGTNSKEISYTYDELLGLSGKTAKTFYDVVNDINNLGLNIKASYDAEYDRFSFYNTKDGSGNNIELTFGSGLGDNATSRANVVARNFFENMGLYQSENGKLIGENDSAAEETDSNYLQFALGSTEKIEGKDATIKIDGMSYKSSDNKITKDGITYEAVAETTSPARISVSQDVDAIVDKVKSFVEDYNKLLSSLYEKYDEKPDSNYKPLTQAQKDSMKEEQVEKWEEKAKAGILYHDQTLSKIILNMRSAVSQQVELDDGTTISAFNIGISTVAGNIKGQLTLNEDKLRAALANDSDSVYKVFASLDAKDNTNTEKMGIAQRLGDVFTSATKTIRTRAGSSTDVTEDSDLNNLLRQLQTKMSNFKKLMNAFEDKLYKKYDTMESTLARLGMQLNFISGVGQG